MYESFFQLKQRPFASAPRSDRYFPAPAIEAARQALTRCIERAEGAGMLVGPSGTGKTLVCQLLAEQFRQQFAVALLSNGHLTTRRELLQAILFELGLPYRRMEEGELRLSLIDHLSSDDKGAQGLLLLLDEAHTFPIRLLEEVRLITNLVRHGQPRVRLVLAGSPVLEERFASPRLEAFSQRIASRSYLEPFDLAQTRQYVIAQLAAVGGDAQRIFASDALDAVYRATDGVARLVNQVCDHALMLALAGGRRQLNAAGIEEAWADLQQLPTPWNDAGRAERREPASDGIIEFGGLDDDLDATGEDSPETAAEAMRRPIVSLHQVQGHVAALEEEFRPVATIGPLPQPYSSQPPRSAGAVRNDRREFEHEPDPKSKIQNQKSPADPFAERFEDEEVLVDRYASFDMAGLEARAQVRSQEGRVLSALLAPFVQSSATPQPSAQAVRAAFERPRREAGGAPPAAGAGSTAVARPEEEGVAATLDAIDRDLMIVEEDPVPEGAARPAARAAPTRRLEYRQLFSTLRRG